MHKSSCFQGFSANPVPKRRGPSGECGLEQVGYYHGSRVVPLLLISFADVLSGIVMPHLSRDWEAGRHSEVGRQLKFCLKLTGLGMIAFGVVVLEFAPLLFDVVLQGKYSSGLAVLPWTLAGCVWFGIYLVAQNYLWCTEKTRLATLPLAIGLIVNIVLNLLLLPHWGLVGAVVATGTSTLICLIAILLLSARHGMVLDRGLWLIAVAPVGLATGQATAVGALLVPLSTPLIFSNDEWAQLRKLLADTATKIRPFLPQRLSQTDPT